MFRCVVDGAVAHVFVGGTSLFAPGATGCAVYDGVLEKSVEFVSFDAGSVHHSEFTKDFWAEALQ